MGFSTVGVLSCDTFFGILAELCVDVELDFSTNEAARRHERTDPMCKRQNSKAKYANCTSQSRLLQQCDKTG